MKDGGLDLYNFLKRLGRKGYVLVTILFAFITVFVVFVIYYGSHIGAKIQKDFNAFIESCDYTVVEAKSFYKGVHTGSKIITDKETICTFWKMVKESHEPRQIQRKIYEYSIRLMFFKEDTKIVVISLAKDANSDIVRVIFYSGKSSRLFQGTDDNGLIEELYHEIANESDQ